MPSANSPVCSTVVNSVTPVVLKLLSLSRLSPAPWACAIVAASPTAAAELSSLRIDFLPVF